MRRIAAFVIGALPILVATGAYAQTQVPQLGGTVQGPVLLPGDVGSGTNPPPPTEFMLGRMPVQVWAPVVPPYDTTADRNGASNPLWGPS
jgi:hypothetical protein